MPKVQQLSETEHLATRDASVEMMAKRSVIQSERGPDLEYDVLEAEEGTPEIYVDGFTGLTFSVSTVRLDLYSVIGFTTEDDKKIEQRLLKLRLVLPTVNFLDLCKKSLESMRGNKEAISKSLESYGDQLRQHIMTAAAEPSDSKKET